jgi:two-component system NarL family response regulator
MSAHQLKVMVADDHSLYRAGLRELLEEDELKVVSEASNGEEAVRQAVRTHPDVVIMDVRMPGMDGIEASRQIKEQLPRTEIVMVTGADDDQDQMFRAIDAGARAYVGKDEPPTVIVEAVRSAAEGEAYLPPHAVKMLFDRIASTKPIVHKETAAPVAPDKRLTPREKEVLRLLARGRRNQEIATEMGLSVRSVGNHLAKIYNKLHIHGRSEAVLYAIKSGIASTT